jgi:hypothetical protein
MEIEELHRVVVQGFASLGDKIDSGLARVDGRIDSLEAKVDEVALDVARVKDVVMEHGRQLKDIRTALDRKVDRDELAARH